MCYLIKIGAFDLTTKDLLKVKFVLVCALVSAAENERVVVIPTERLMNAVSIINKQIDFRDDNRLETKNQAALAKSLLRSCRYLRESSE